MFCSCRMSSPWEVSMFVFLNTTGYIKSHLALKIGIKMPCYIYHFFWHFKCIFLWNASKIEWCDFWWHVSLCLEQQKIENGQTLTLMSRISMYEITGTLLTHEWDYNFSTPFVSDTLALILVCPYWMILKQSLSTAIWTMSRLLSSAGQELCCL